MPIPAVAVAIFKIAMVALTVYETLDVLKDIYDGLDAYDKSVEKAKKELQDLLEQLKKEIDQKIDEKQEVQILLSAAGADPQGAKTKKAQGRGSGNAVIDAAIEQRIPFRQIISEVCEKADSMPVLSLRRKRGVQLKDLSSAKRKALEDLLEKGFETITEQDLDNFIIVRLKQLAADLMFEFVDYCLDWQSPLKCEVSFGPKPTYADHPVEGATKLKRSDSKVNPFYPTPHRQRGSISADLVIPDYRKKRCDKSNIFAIVEVKFEGDRIDSEQLKQYRQLLDYSALTKTKASPVRFDNQAVSSGGRLSLFRYPEDVADGHGQDKKRPAPRSKTGKDRD